MRPPSVEERQHALDALYRHELAEFEALETAPYASYARKVVAALKVEIGTAVAGPEAAAALGAAAKTILLLAENARRSVDCRRVKRGNRAFATRVGRWRASAAVLAFLDFEVQDAIVRAGKW